MSCFRLRRGFAAAFAAVFAGLLLAGCGAEPVAHAPNSAPPVAPTSVSPTPLNLSACDDRSLDYLTCKARAHRAAEQSIEDAAEQNEEAYRAYAAAMAEHRAAQAEAQSSLWGRVNVLLVLGVLLLSGGGYLLWSGFARIVLPAGRDRRGPAAGLVLVRAQQRRCAGAFTSALAAILLSAAVSGPLATLLVALAALPGAGWAFRRVLRALDADAGYRQADKEWRAELAEAKAAAASNAKAPHDDWDLGLPVEVPDVVVPPEPHLTFQEAVVYGKTGGILPEHGSAAARLLDKSGDPKPARRAWLQACKSANLGDWTGGDENGAGKKFTAAAKLVAVTALPDGDCRLTVAPRTIQVGAPQLASAIPPFLRAAGVAHAADWVRDPDSNRHSVVISNAPGGGSPAADDDEGWA